MAVRLLTTSATLSTSAGSWKKLEYFNFNPTFTAATFDDLNTIRYTPASGTMATGRILQGAVVYIRRATLGSGNLVIQLQENTGTWADVAGASSTTAINTTNFPAVSGIQYFTFGTPYTVPNTTNTYRLKVSTTAAAGVVFLWRDSSTNHCYGLVGDGDDATKIASGDTAIIAKGQTLTIDENLTLGPTSNRSLIIGDGATIAIPNPASPITLDLGAGQIVCSTNATFTAGSVGTPITAGYLTINTSATVSTQLFAWPIYYNIGAGSAALLHNEVIEMHGATSSNLRLTVAADAASGQGVITTTTTIPASWTNGDTVTLAAKDAAMVIDNQEYTIVKGASQVEITRSRNATMTIASPCVVTITTHGLVNGSPVIFTTTGALPTGVTAGSTYYARSTGTNTFNLYDTAAHAIAGGTTGRVDTSGSQSGVHTCADTCTDYTVLAGGAILNISEARRMGIKIVSTNEIAFMNASTWADHYLLSGVCFEKVNPYLGGDYTGYTATTSYMKSCFFYYSSVLTAGILAESKGSMVIDNSHFICRQFGYGACTFQGKNFVITNITLKSLGLAAASLTGFLRGNNNSIDGVIYWGSGGSGYNYAAFASANACTISNAWFAGIGISLVSGAGNIFTNVKQQKNGTSHGIYLLSAFAKFINSTIGVGTGNTKDIYFTADAFGQITLQNCNLGTSGVDLTTMVTMVDGSFVRFTNYNGTAGDNRSWYANGHFLSATNTLEALTDVTTETLTNTYNVSSDTVATFSVRAIVGCKIDNAAYYAGTYTAPTLHIDYDSTSTASIAAANNTTQQTLGVTITPTTSNNPVTLRLAQKTDAVMANSKVTWDNLTLRERKYGYTPIEKIKVITATTDDIVLNLDTMVADSFITESVAATVAAYTDFTFNHTTKTITLNSNTTKQRLYDRCQYEMAQDLSIEKFYYTSDNANFTCTYDIICGAYRITSSTTDVLSLGSKNFTYSGSGGFDGVVVDTDGRLVKISLSGLISGSTVQIYNTTDATELYKAVVGATSYELQLLYTANKALRIRVRKSDYETYETTGTLTNFGYSQTVSQSADSIYNNNAIDGSTVTEFSLSEGVVGIFVDDPTNATTAQRMYNWYKYAISTTTFIDDQANLITAQTSWSYVLDDTILIKNQDLVNPLFLTGANLNNVSNTGVVIDTTGGNININGYFPFNSASDVGDAVIDAGALTVGKFLALK